MRAAALLVVACTAAGDAAADRGIHATAAAGGSVVATGAGGDRGRLDAELDVKPRSRFGGLVAWRAFDGDHRGVLYGGVVYEAAAARPRVVLDLHAGLGADLDAGAPVAGGGLRTTLGLYGPLGLVLDTGAYLVVDGFSDTRLQLQSAALIAARW